MTLSASTMESNGLKGNIRLTSRISSRTDGKEIIESLPAAVGIYAEESLRWITSGTAMVAFGLVSSFKLALHFLVKGFLVRCCLLAIPIGAEQQSSFTQSADERNPKIVSLF